MRDAEIGCQDGEGDRGRREPHTGVAYLYPIRRLGKRGMGKVHAVVISI
jgi:hypothetical protein